MDDGVADSGDGVHAQRASSVRHRSEAMPEPNVIGESDAGTYQ
jgi:hypothetical protein